MYAPRKQAGFTLVELMIVITIVGIVLAAAGPTLGHTMVNRRAIELVHEVQRIGRDAYWEAVRYRRAHVVYFEGMEGPTGTPGRVELLRGNSNLCSENWQNLRTAYGACGTTNSRCVAEVDAADSRFHGFDDVRPVLTRAGNTPTAAFCYRPNGVVMWSDTLPSAAAGFTNVLNNNGLNGGMVFTVQIYEGTTASGVARRVLYPLGGPPRRIR